MIYTLQEILNLETQDEYYEIGDGDISVIKEYDTWKDYLCDAWTDENIPDVKCNLVHLEEQEKEFSEYVQYYTYKNTPTIISHCTIKWEAKYNRKETCITKETYVVDEPNHKLLLDYLGDLGFKVNRDYKVYDLNHKIEVKLNIHSNPLTSVNLTHH